MRPAHSRPFFPRAARDFVWRISLICSAIFFPSGRVEAQPSSAGYTWKNVVMKGGGFVSGLIFHPTQADLLYARTDVGGAYRWDNAVQQWLPLSDALGRDDSQLTGVLSLALDPHDATRV